MATANLTCPTCSTRFVRKHGRQRYCGPACRADEHPKTPMACTRCGVVVMKYPGDRYQPFCAMSCRDLYRREQTAAKAKLIPTRPPYDPRSALRRAVEDGKPADVLREIRDRCTITSTGCWEWDGRRTKDGYPEITIGVRYSVHRLSLEAKLGAPLGDQPAHHMCANTMCVNPDHLQAVTHRENTAEMLARTYMERRIIALETALTSIAPEHPLLTEVSILR